MIQVGRIAKSEDRKNTVKATRLKSLKIDTKKANDHACTLAAMFNKRSFAVHFFADDAHPLPRSSKHGWKVGQYGTC